MSFSLLLFLCVFALFIYLSNGTTYNWEEIYASDAGASDFFGVSVSISEDTVLVGAYGNDDLGTDAGAAYIFTKDSTTGNWTQNQRLLASDGGVADYFGYSVGLSGNVAIIGAKGDDDLGTDRGAAYIFTKDETSGNFTQTTKLLGNDSDALYCGASVAISGNSAIMGCFLSTIGYAYIFEYINGGWEQSAVFKGTSATYFGWSVSIYDSLYAIVGATLDDTAGTDAGAAFIYSKDSVTSRWSYEEALYASDASISDIFGWSVCICNDYAMVGAVLDDDVATDAGAAYVFKRNSVSSTWNQTQKLKSLAGEFGNSISINCDDSNYYAIIGARYNDELATDAGAAFLFELEIDLSGEEHWNQTKEFFAYDGSASDFFGWSVSASDDEIVIGSVCNDNKATDAGSAYLLSNASTTSTTTTNAPTTAPSGEPSVAPSNSQSNAPTNAPSNSLVECDDTSCCADTQIGGNTVYCRGYNACKNSTMNISDYLYCKGDDACSNSIISSESGDIYCSGDNGCSECEIEGLNVECNGYLSCNKTTIVSNYTECSGYYGCSHSTISSRKELTISSYRSCEYSVITNTQSIYSYGELSLTNSEISTYGVNNFKLVSKGIWALQDAKLYCYSGSTCVVNCGDGSTCDGLNYYCDTSGNGANCHLHCNDSCTTCPEIISTNLSLSQNLKTVVTDEWHEREKDKDYYFINGISDHDDGGDDEKNQLYKMIYLLGIYAVISTAIITLSLICNVKGAFGKVSKFVNGNNANYTYSLIPDP